ncbi:MAG: hypothetical protein HY813_00170 [Candidatus Portnoybacteria bacterium]|nr:hypothetical protein [Candidatus Portnoybacteria bacterium]
MNKTTRNQIILLFLTLAIAAFFRFYKLAEIPPGLYHDVAINGNDAAAALKTGDFRVFYPENNGREGLFINLIAFSFSIFGISVWSIKIVAATIGTLTVLGIYLMTNELFALKMNWREKITIANSESRKNTQGTTTKNLDIKNWNFFRNSSFGIENLDGAKVALLSTFFLAISFWHIIFSRIGFRAIMVPFFLVWGFYFLFLGLRTTRMTQIEHSNDQNESQKTSRFVLHALYFILAGLLFGLGFHTYISYRIVPLVWMIILLIEIYNYWPRFKSLISDRLSLTTLIKKVYIKDGWWYWDIGFLAIIIAALPIVFYFYHNPQDFMGRSTQVSVFTSGNPIKQLFINIAQTLGLFNFRGDCNWRHNYACQPELFWPVGILFLIGVVISIKRVLRPIFLVITRKSRDMRRGDNETISGSRHEIASPPSANLNDDLPVSVWSPAQISLFLLTWFFALLLPEILSNEGLPHALRAIGAIPPVFIFAGMGGIWLIDRLYLLTSSPQMRGGLKRGVDKFITTPPSTPSSTEEGKTNSYLVVIVILIFSITLLAKTYNYYFINWGKNPEVQGAHAQHLVDIGDYLNRLPDDTKKYVIANEGGVRVPFPDGIPMPAQTIMFIARETTNIAYLKLEQLQSITDQSIVVLIKYDENILNQLQKMFPRGKIIEENEIWIFKISA